MVIAWNQRVLAIAEAEDHFHTLNGLRTVSMMHLAMHDALNAIRREYGHYAYRSEAKDANPAAAATQVAYDVAVNQYPGHGLPVSQPAEERAKGVIGAQDASWSRRNPRHSRIAEKRRDDSLNEQ